MGISTFGYFQLDETNDHQAAYAEWREGVTLYNVHHLGKHFGLPFLIQYLHHWDSIVIDMPGKGVNQLHLDTFTKGYSRNNIGVQW